MVAQRVAIIPARGGSKRLPGKNILDFNGKPMIAWTIEAALNSKLFDEVLVSTDSEEIAELSIKYGASVPFLRGKNYDDYSTVSEATITAINELFVYNNKSYQIVVQLMANCPLRTAESIIEQVQFFEKQGSNNSVLSGFRYGMFNPWWAHFQDSEGKFRRLYNQNDINTRSQDLPELICPSGAIWVSAVDRLVQNGTFYSDGFTFYQIDWKEAIDIDDQMDLDLAKIASKLRDESI